MIFQIKQIKYTTLFLFLQKENSKSENSKSQHTGNDSANDAGDVANKKTKSWKNVNKNDDENDDSWRINFLLKQRVIILIKEFINDLNDISHHCIIIFQHFPHYFIFRWILKK